MKNPCRLLRGRVANAFTVGQSKFPQCEAGGRPRAPDPGRPVKWFVKVSKVKLTFERPLIGPMTWAYLIGRLIAMPASISPAWRLHELTGWLVSTTQPRTLFSLHFRMLSWKLIIILPPRLSPYLKFNRCVVNKAQILVFNFPQCWSAFYIFTFSRCFFNFFICSGNKTECRNDANGKLNIVHLPHNVHKVLAEVSGLQALSMGQSEAEK